MNTQHCHRIMNPAALVVRLATTRRACAMLLIALTSSLANAQGPLVAWGDDSGGMVSGAPSGSFVAVAAGWSVGVSHAVGIRTNGTLASWGDSVMVNDTPTGTFTAVATGGRHALAIRSDGTLASWGDDSQGQVSATPAGTFTAIATSGWHAVAIRSDGTLAAWGNDYNFAWGTNGQVSGPNSDGGTFIAVACGGAIVGGNTHAIRADGTIAAWGSDPQSWEPAVSPSGTFSAISANDYYYAAIRTNGSLVEWSVDVALETPGTFVALATAAGQGGPARLGTTIAIHADGTLVGMGDDSFGKVSGIPTGTYSAVAAAWGGPVWGGFTGAGFCVAIATPTGNQPPVIMSNGPVALWSPNHALLDVSSAFGVSDPDGDPVELTFRVFSDETEIPDTGDGTGQHAPDFKTVLASGAPGLFLRSERRGAEDGRFYVVVITADDGHGGVTSAACVAALCPRDQNQQSLDDVLAQAAMAAGHVQSLVDTGTLPAPGQSPQGLTEHGLAAPRGPFQ
jgi:hypothetical protein